MVKTIIKTQKSKIKEQDKKPKIVKTKTSAVEATHSLNKRKVSTNENKVSVKKVGVLVAGVYDISGKVVEEMDLPKDVFGARVNKKLIAQAIRVYLANQRAGSASTKTRGEVRGSTRKIYRQKGTGRARHGAVRAPIFVHGGIAHGPKSRDFGLKMPQKMKRAALNSLLSLKLQNNEVKVLTGFEKTDNKTKNIAQFLNNINLTGKKILFVLNAKHENLILAVRNINEVTYEYVKQLSVFEIMRNNEILFTKDSIADLENLMKKNNQNK